MWQWIRSNATNDANLAAWGCTDLQHSNATIIIPPALSEQRSLRQSSSQMTTVQSRRRLKSSLYFAFVLIAASFSSTTTSIVVVEAFSAANYPSGLSQRKQQWIDRSVAYYSSVMRNNGVGKTTSSQNPRQHETPVASNILDDGTTSLTTNQQQQQQQLYGSVDSVVDKDFIGLATKHYYARVLIKMGKWECAERLYRRIIEELTYESEEAGENCDHTKLAVSTLLLALHMQRTGDVRATRSVFLRFFRRVAFLEQNEDEEEGVGHKKCACSAKVLQAYALFEMKNGIPKKSLEIIRRAVQMDEGLRPVLSWKQFRDVAAGRAYSPTFTFRKTTWEHQVRLRQQQQEKK
jgi:hypothetical protein